MSQVFGDSKRLVNDYMAASHAIGIRYNGCPEIPLVYRVVGTHGAVSNFSINNSGSDGRRGHYMYRLRRQPTV